jgi:hypothetical protein
MVRRCSQLAMLRFAVSLKGYVYSPTLMGFEVGYRVAD